MRGAFPKRRFLERPLLEAFRGEFTSRNNSLFLYAVNGGELDKGGEYLFIGTASVTEHDVQQCTKLLVGIHPRNNLNFLQIYPENMPELVASPLT